MPQVLFVTRWEEREGRPCAISLGSVAHGHARDPRDPRHTSPGAVWPVRCGKRRKGLSVPTHNLRKTDGNLLGALSFSEIISQTRREKDGGHRVARGRSVVAGLLARALSKR
jgi:hypothetical protein